MQDMITFDQYARTFAEHFEKGFRKGYSLKSEKHGKVAVEYPLLEAYDGDITVPKELALKQYREAEKLGFQAGLDARKFEKSSFASVDLVTRPVQGYCGM